MRIILCSLLILVFPISILDAQEKKKPPRLEALEHTNRNVFVAKANVPQATQRHLEKIVILSAIVYSAEDVAPGAVDKKYGLTGEVPWIVDRTEAKQLMKAKVASLDKSLKARCAGHLRKYPYWGTVYHAYVLESFANAPHFKFNHYFHTYTEEKFRKGSEDMSKLMRSVFESGGGQKGWKPLFDVMQKYQVKPEILSAIEKRLYRYVRMKKSPDLSFTVIYNPLMRPEVGSNAFPNPDNRNAIVFISGPWPNQFNLFTNISHEMMHPVMNRIFKESRAFQEAIRRTEAVNQQIGGERWGYNGWFNYFAEETIRCVSSRIEKAPQMQFKHAKFITSKLFSHEAEEKESFEHFLIRVLDGLHAQLDKN